MKGLGRRQATGRGAGEGRTDVGRIRWRKSGQRVGAPQRRRCEDPRRTRGPRCQAAVGQKVEDWEVWADQINDLVETPGQREEMSSKLLDAVVKVYCLHSEPSFSMPWQRSRQYSSYSTGFVIESPSGKGKGWLLTNAHSVAFSTVVKVKKRGDDRKYTAKVLCTCREGDMALMTVDDEDFWKDITPLEFGPLPRLQDEAVVVGYPVGGETISVTSGVVSRCETTSYVHGSRELLGIQIDAAINSGNSGGPVFDRNGRCCGIAFQSYDAADAENIGWIIPTPVVAHFLAEYARTRDSVRPGFPVIGVYFQKIESDALRAKHGLERDHKGIMIRAIEPTSCSHGVLEKGDVLLEFEGTEIACDGTVPFRKGERIAFGHLISQKFIGDEAKVKVLRNGESLDLTLKLGGVTRKIPLGMDDDPPYLVVGGLVFTAVTVLYLRSEFGDDFERNSPVRLLSSMYSMAEHEDQQVVVLSQILASEATTGYEPDEFSNLTVQSFNGQPVRNLKELARLVDACDSDFLEFEVGEHYKELLVLERKVVAQATEEIMKQHSIPAPSNFDIA
ncbi:DegP-like serine protease [Chloropicon primus]|uniref:DegP-like serine protease n=2 Tax=Chloropicon primus TaxID=1764295 RepID=A0A5B8MVN1_9CHLO|nr:DegP-like serine protease [Chloropicon primus]UPR03807.1 DegP-like serine protease [Chloropicon primus]|eukprot:QDZ24599.1 DegP-like serine protease [Chloropicon primus]